MLDLNTFYYKGYLGYYDEGLKPKQEVAKDIVDQVIQLLHA